MHKLISPKILILEEDLNLQWILKTFLESKGFSIIVLDKAEQVLEIVSKVKISIFITEYWINQSSTLETIKRLKQTSPQIYVLLNTYRIIDEKDYQQIIEAGVDGLFEKPFSFEKMMIHLKKNPKRRSAYVVKETGRKRSVYGNAFILGRNEG
jgi:DNA-binding response OmpR family regulator